MCVYNMCCCCRTQEKKKNCNISNKNIRLDFFCFFFGFLLLYFYFFSFIFFSFCAPVIFLVKCVLVRCFDNVNVARLSIESFWKSVLQTFITLLLDSVAAWVRVRSRLILTLNMVQSLWSGDEYACRIATTIFFSRSKRWTRSNSIQKEV